ALRGAVLGGVSGVDHGVDALQVAEAVEQAAQGCGGVDPVVVAGGRRAVQMGVGQVPAADYSTVATRGVRQMPLSPAPPPSPTPRPRRSGASRPRPAA